MWETMVMESHQNQEHIEATNFDCKNAPFFIPKVHWKNQSTGDK